MKCRSGMLITALCAAFALTGCSKDKPKPPRDPEPPKAAEGLIDAGVKYLLAHRDPAGGWSMPISKDKPYGGARPAITAMVLKILTQHPKHGPRSAEVTKGFEVLLGYQQKDGGIYAPGEGRDNYSTSLAVMALAAAKDPAHSEAMADAIKFLRGVVIRVGSKTPGGQEITPTHPMLGGVSYGTKHGRPDNSNAGMWVQAMNEAGISGDDPDIQAVVAFINRSQNLSEKNDLLWIRNGPNDGGYVYAPASRDNIEMGQSKAGPGPGGKGLRSYGSMTYVGFKSMLHADVDRDDPRVKAAFLWIREHWTLEQNPNMLTKQSLQGLYYYYHVYAKALRAWGQNVIKDRDGNEHDWRKELVAALSERINADGSWANSESRWGESVPVLATSYAVLALQETLKK